MRRFFLCAMVLGLGCSKMQQINKPTTGSRPDPMPLPGTGAGKAAGTGVSSGDFPVSRKSVSGKEPPATLIALDGSRCGVTEARYREISNGEYVWCAWRTQ